MKKSLIAYSGLLIITVFFYGCAHRLSQRVYVKGASLKVQVAESNAEKEKGLMFRESMAEDQGMLFVFEKEGYYSFWMKNMRFALDIIWLGRDKRIVDISQDVRPCTTI